MSLNSTSQLAKLLADQTSETDEIKSNISPDDLNSSLPIFVNEPPIKITGTITVTAYIYATNSFIIDHPVYSKLDDPNLLLDGGYAEEGLTMPVTMPVDLGSNETVLYTTSF